MYTSSVLEKGGIIQPGRIVQIEEVENALSFRVRFTYQQHTYDIYNRVHDNDRIYHLHDAVEVLFLPDQPEEAIINSEKRDIRGMYFFWRRLWLALPEEYRTGIWYFPDVWEAYGQVLPPQAHRPSPKGSGQTSIVEAINCSLRQKCGVLVRKSCSFSRSLAMHHVRIQLVIDEHNRRCTPH